MEATQSNPAMALLQQAMELISPKMSIPVVIDYDAITKAAVRTVAEERKKSITACFSLKGSTRHIR